MKKSRRCLHMFFRRCILSISPLPQTKSFQRAERIVPQPRACLQPDSERENKYLQGGASPSTRQTLQYLLRNDILENIEALMAEIAYLIREREAVASNNGKGDTSEADLDEKDLKMYFGKCKNGFDKYLGMVFQSEIDQATEYAKVAMEAKENKTST